MAFHKLSEKWSGSTSSTSDSDSMKQRMSANVCEFRAAIKQLLSTQEQEDIRHILSCYHRNSNVYYLAESLKSLLDTPEKRTIFPTLKKIIPKSDRSSFDQYTSEEPFVRSMSSSRTSTMSHLRTIDSGIGSNQAGYCSANQASTSNSSINAPSIRTPQPPRRSSSMSDLSHKSFQKNAKAFSASTFGSAVRRKVRAVLARRGSSSSVELKSTVQRRYSSETQMDKLGLEEEQNVKPKRNGSFKDKLRPKRQTKQKDLVCIKLVRKNGKEFGFTIGGGSEVGSGIFISEVDPGSSADSAGLKKRDLIVKVNDIPFNGGISHNMAVEILSSVENLNMFVKPYKSKQVSPDDVPWVDTHGRPASPPHSISKKNQYAKPVLDSRRSSLHMLQAGERKVTLSVNSRQSLGLMVRGGSEYGLGIYVTGVDLLSAAENAGLKAGDEILEVNNVSLEGASHAEAVSLIKSSPLLIMTVRYVGRIPQNQHASVSSKMADDRISWHSSTTSRKLKKAVNKDARNGIMTTFQRKMMSNNQMILPNMLTQSPIHQSAIKISSTMATLEEALLASDIWMTLSDSERRCLRYYVKEYATGNVTPDALVLALSELLDTPEKSSLMGAVRECISGKDLDRFDVLVLRREVEALRSNQPPPPPPPEDVSFGSNEYPTRSSTPEDFVSSLVSTSPADPIEAEDGASRIFYHHNSTPNNSLTVSKNNFDSEDYPPPKLSPVRPSNPPPPIPNKTPPVKPKRKSSLTRKKSIGEKRNSEIKSPPSSMEEDHVYSVVNKVKKEERAESPFALALENHISSHSGRIKASIKANNHPSIPDPSFFEGPKSDYYTKPNFSSFIKPVKNPTIKLLKERNQKSIITSPPETTTSNNTVTMSAASSTSSLSDSVDFSMPKLSFRPVTFGNSVNEKVTKSKPFSVKADVHTEPSTKKTDVPKPIVIRDYQDPFTGHVTSNSNTDDVNACDDDDYDDHPCLADDVDTQKIVIFKTASTLGLTIEGGAGTQQPLPRVLKVQRGSCAQMCGRIKKGHVIHEANGKSLKNLSHHDVVKVIALAFKQEDRDSIELVLSGPY